MFLGTGLGARSYSIIEQGMISQIVEARPEELRMHLEEAAGISKYKERRKETESRIKATRENLDRLNDVRNEVEKTLEHLNRQARAAERWQKLKAAHARVEAELKALSLKAHEAELAGRTEALKALELEIEKHVAEQRHVEAQLEGCPRTPASPPPTSSTGSRPRSTASAARSPGSSSRSSTTRTSPSAWPAPARRPRRNWPR